VILNIFDRTITNARAGLHLTRARKRKACGGKIHRYKVPTMDFSPEETAFISEVSARADELRACDDFRAAMFKFTGWSLAHYLSTAPDMRPLVKDKASYLMGLSAVYLFHAGATSLTAAALRNTALTYAVCSKGRASAIVTHMVKSGLLIAEQPRTRGTRLVLGPRLETYFIDELRSTIDSMLALSPVASQALARLDDPAFFGKYVRIVLPFGAAMFQAFGDGPPEIRLFTQRDAGWPIALDLLNTAPDAPAAISVSRLAARFAVSRPHILKLLKDADTAGLLTWSAKTREAAVTPMLQMLTARVVAGAFAITEAALNRALAVP